MLGFIIEFYYQQNYQLFKSDSWEWFEQLNTIIIKVGKRNRKNLI